MAIEYNYKEKIEPKGFVEIKVFNRDNEVIDRFSNHNLIIDSGLRSLAEVLTEKRILNINQIAYGDGTMPPGSSDTRLVNEVGRNRIIAAVTRGNKAIFGTYFGFNFPGSTMGTITEYGLFVNGNENTDYSTDSPSRYVNNSGVLFARTTIESHQITKTSENAFSITWNIEIQASGD